MSGSEARKLGSAKVSHLCDRKMLQRQSARVSDTSVEVMLPVPMSASGMACALVVTKVESKGD